MKSVDRDSLLSQYDAHGRTLGAARALPDGNHGEIIQSKESKLTAPQNDRSRLSVDLSPVVMSSLDHWDMRTGRNMMNRKSSPIRSLDHWDMRTGRNLRCTARQRCGSLDHWDMRTGRNRRCGLVLTHTSLDHWDMRTGRNSNRELIESL